MTKYLQGKDIAKRIKSRVEEELEELSVPVKMVSVLATHNEASCYYAESQRKAFAQLGIAFQIHRISSSSSEEEVIEKIVELNEDRNVTGILLVMPLPKGVNPYHVRKAISPLKDVEGITPTNMGKLFYGDFSVAPCTAKAVWLLLQETNVPMAGKEAVVISHSEIVGKPLLSMLLHSPTGSPTVTCCHIATRDLKKHTRSADIVIAAAGKAGLVTGDMLKPGAILIDVGINLVQDPLTKTSRVVGDVNPSSVEGIAAFLTPVPGGVGTVTTAVLLENCIRLVRRAE